MLVVETVFIFVYFISWLIFITCCVYLSIYLCLSIYAVKIYHKNYIPIKHIQPSYINFMWTLTIFCFFNNKKKLYTIYLLSFFLLSTYCISVVFCCCCFYNELFYIRIQKKSNSILYFFLFVYLFFLFLHIMCVSQCFSIISHMNVFLCVLLFFFRALQPTSKISKISKIDIEIFYFFLAVFFLNKNLYTIN